MHITSVVLRLDKEFHTIGELEEHLRSGMKGSIIVPCKCQEKYK